MKIIAAKDFLKSFESAFKPWWHPRELWYSLRCFLWNRYSTVRARYLPHAWCDRSDLLHHCAFEILSQFIEKECSPGHVEWYGEHAHKVEVNGKEVFVRDEMQEIYDWWNSKANGEYKQLSEEIYDSMPIPTSLWAETEGELLELDTQYETEEDEQKAKEACEKATELESRIEKETEEYLIRLVRIRKYMWT